MVDMSGRLLGGLKPTLQVGFVVYTWCAVVTDHVPQGAQQVYGPI
jgi:hypothetical protein